MLEHRPVATRSALLVATLGVLLLSVTHADAFPETLTAWQDRYNPPSISGDNANCQLCHVDKSEGEPWNAYGWDIRVSLADGGCDFDGSGSVSHEEAFFCVELVNSDGDGSRTSNVKELGLNTQPGWTLGPNNKYYFRSGEITTDHLPPAGIGFVDPDGTEPPPPPPPPPPADSIEAEPDGANASMALPPESTACASCLMSLAPSLELARWVERELPDAEPLLCDGGARDLLVELRVIAAASVN